MPLKRSRTASSDAMLSLWSMMSSSSGGRVCARIESTALTRSSGRFFVGMTADSVKVIVSDERGVVRASGSGSATATDQLMLPVDERCRKRPRDQLSAEDTSSPVRDGSKQREV